MVQFNTLAGRTKMKVSEFQQILDDIPGSFSVEYDNEGQVVLYTGLYYPSDYDESDEDPEMLHQPESE